MKGSILSASTKWIDLSIVLSLPLKLDTRFFRVVVGVFQTEQRYSNSLEEAHLENSSCFRQLNVTAVVAAHI